VVDGWRRASQAAGHVQWSPLHSAHAAASLVYSPAFCCHPRMKEIKQDAAVSGRSCHADHRPLFDRRNNDYVTAFHLASWLPVEDSQPCTTDMDNELCDLMNARRWVTITYRHTDTTDSPMFSLAPMFPMSDMRISLTLIVVFFYVAVLDSSDCRSCLTDHVLTGMCNANFKK